MTHDRRKTRTLAAFGAMMGTVVLGGCSGSNSAPQASAGASTTTSTPSPNSGEKGEMNTQSKTTTNSPRSTPQTTGNPGKIVKTDAEWKKQLTPEQYRILREKGTEPAFTGKYWNTKTPGNYKCAACGEILFTSNEKFDSHCGWPSFYKALDKSKVEEHVDTTFGMKRTEVVCAKCGGHLGHVFDDAPDMPTGLRYCINSESIVLEQKGDQNDESAKFENQPEKARK